MSCVVEGCKAHSSRKKSRDELITFHRFPNDDETRMKWIQCINRSNWTPKKYSKICSKHFANDSFWPNDNIKWRRLKSNAVPMLNIPNGMSTFVLKTESSTEAEHSLAELTSGQYQNIIKTEPSIESVHSLAEPTSYQSENIVKTEPSIESVHSLAEPTSYHHQYENIMKTEPSIEAVHSLAEPTSYQYENIMKTEPSTEVEHSIAEPTSYQYENGMDPPAEIKMEDTSNNLLREISSISCTSTNNEIEAPNEKRIRLLEKKLKISKNVSKRRLRRINTLTKRIARLSKKHDDLYTELVDKVRQVDKLENFESKFNNILDIVNKNEIFRRFFHKQYDQMLPREYSPELKKFAVTLHHLSPKAYLLVREQLENVLPHPNSMSGWNK